ncbi:MAG TPA: SpoIIE family protein phosphatase [Pseudonocardiaceae bacterium]|jgi:PAS domain S-box-containing protein|nr:SpoIIE family protein phosphatase [Pseudonocardiaceae bacterium]
MGSGDEPRARVLHSERQLELLRNRAVIATDRSFTVSDPHRQDHPLVWVNPSFTRLTGYGVAEAVGRNCRFLQGPDTDRQAVERIGKALEEGHASTEVLLNYRKDGSAFWNEVTISPVTDAAGRIGNFVGVQTDVTERVLVEQERRLALATAEEVRNDLRLLTDATTWMTESRNVADAADRLTQSVVPALADYCCVDLLDEVSGRADRVAAYHRNPGQVAALYELADRISPRVGGPDSISQVLTSGEPLLMSDLLEGPERSASPDPDAVRLHRQLRPRSVLRVPLRARGEVLGVLTLCSEEPYGRRYRQRDLHLAVDLASKAALAIDNTRAYARMREAAETLQLSLLPAVRPVDGVCAASRYLPGTHGARVGGDWYDLLELPDGATAMAVGDVVGHDLRAAAAMGQLRGLLRSYAWEGLRSGTVLDRCDQLVQGLEMAAMATAVYARLEPSRNGEPRQLTYSNAGHPPPLLRRPGGPPEFLDANLSPLLGAIAGPGRTEARVSCPPGSLLLLYTDGLTDLPGEDAERRQQRLYEVVAGMGDDANVEELCDRVLAGLVPGSSPYDDVALLAVCVEGH